MAPKSMSQSRQALARQQAARQRVAALILPVIRSTLVARYVATTEQPDTIPGITIQLVANNVDQWVITGDSRDRPLTDKEFEAAARADVPTLLAENKRLAKRVAELEAQVERLRAVEDLVERAESKLNPTVDTADLLDALGKNGGVS